MQRARWVPWKQVEQVLGLSRGSTRSSPSYSCSLPLWNRSDLSLSPFSTSSDGEPRKDGEKPPRRKKMSRKERFGTYDKTFEDELDMVPLEEGITHLYNTRGIVDKWLGQPTLDSIFPDKDLYAKGESPNIDPPGEGPILRWTTRVVLGPGGDAWHPANRKVKLAVYLKELQLTPKAKERMLLIVGKRYNPNNDELTITCERFDLREENRKDALRTLYALIEEANTANMNVLATQGSTVPAEAATAIAS
ncbi:uncharacterized protein [Physcomitrium patens]|uniref:Small ribosomal subunit protein mS35 mitochondrial conserved domain-containing protein n=2 Tax=Physcomitrium patens TaxID=3218 RepID=A0A2K1J0K1_PHYPA|nr:uncharacterized protein LOC112295473 [Physcomitrium patens]PNR35049.1 hypothetical protein PHYPA_022948 [Physcomitrium patens]|eukprot:XP_024402900.1 uncharacterized protein LOC112295473 [Physcomitrella patens]